jgi:hypothetical protein
MGLGVGIFLLAAGAVLTFALHVNPTNGANTMEGTIPRAPAPIRIHPMVRTSSSGRPGGGFTRRREAVDPAGGTHTTIDQR